MTLTNAIRGRFITSLLVAAAMSACAQVDLDKTGVDDVTGHALYERVSDRMIDADDRYVAAMTALEPRIRTLVDSSTNWLAPLPTSDPKGNQIAADRLTELKDLLNQHQSAEFDCSQAMADTVQDLRIHSEDRYPFSVWLRDRATPYFEVNNAWRDSIRRLMVAAQAIAVLGYNERQAGRAKVVDGALVFTPEAEARLVTMRATLVQRTAEFRAAQQEHATLPPRPSLG